MTGPGAPRGRPPGATVGIIANPFAGTDVRRLVSHAVTTSDAARVSMIRRIAVGAAENGAARVVLMDDAKGLAREAAGGLDGAAASFVPLRASGARIDTTRAAAWLRDEGCGAVVVLGGDGTCRDVARGWPEAPLVPVSTGTNNVFPFHVEATVAGAAAGLVAAGRVALGDVAARAKMVHVDRPHSNDIALVEVALVDGQFVGSRAVWDAASVRAVVLARAEPAAVGLSSVGGLLAPCGAADEGGVLVALGPGGRTVRAPVVPGRYEDLAVAAVARLCGDDTVRWQGPAVLAFDGERDAVLGDGDEAVVSVRRDGPWVIDPARALRAAAGG